MFHALRTLLLVSIAVAAGCTPLTRYRQTMLAMPAAPPPSFGAPLPEGEIAAGGWLSEYAGIDVPLGGHLPERGTPGILVPITSYGASVRASIAEGIEIGASYERADDNGARRSALGVLPLQGQTHASAFGAQLTGGHTWDSGLGVGGTLDVALLDQPWTRYQLRDTSLVSVEGALVEGDGAELYDLDGSGTVRPIRVRLTQAASYRGDWFDGAVGLTLAPQTTNDGFSNERPKLLLVGPVSAIPAVDAGVRWRDLRLGAQLWWATRTLRPTNGAYAGLGGRLTAEIHLGRDR